MKKLFEDFALVLEGFSNYKKMLDDVLYQCRGKLISLQGQKGTDFGVEKNGYRRRLIVDIDEDTKITIYFYPFMLRINSAARPERKELHIGILDMLSLDGLDYRHYQTEEEGQKFRENATIKPMDRPKTFDRILGAVAHEVTHISQWKHGGLDWDISRNKKEFDALPPEERAKYKNTRVTDKGEMEEFEDDRLYYSRKTHVKTPTEHEARLIEFLTHVKRKMYEQAFTIFKTNFLYLGGFSKKKFLNTMLDYGITLEEYRRFTEYVFNEIKEIYNTLENKSDGYIFYVKHVDSLFHVKMVEYVKNFAMGYILKYFKNLYFEKGYDKYNELTNRLEQGFKAIG